MTIVMVPISGAVASGRYINQSDIENVFGIDNIARWSQMDNDVDTADTTRIQQAIDTAETSVDDSFRNSEYKIPFTGTISSTIINWCAIIAGAWLYQNRGHLDTGTEDGEKYDRRLKAVREDILKYQTRIKKLDVAAHNPSSPTAPHFF